MFRISYVYQQEDYLYKNFLHCTFSCVYVSSLAGGWMCLSVHFVGLHYITEILLVLGRLRSHITRISYLPCPFILHLNMSYFLEILNYFFGKKLKLLRKNEE
jgi:hypothetical protein